MRRWREQRVGFFPMFTDLAETSRLVRIAERYRELGGEVIFFSHGGDYESLSHKAGLPIRRVEPTYTPEQVEELMKYDRLEKFGDPFPVPWLIEHVLNEEQAYRESDVSLIVTGFNIPCSLSARKAGIPLVWIIPGTALPAYFRAGLATYPDVLENAVTRLLPARLKNWVANRLMLRSKTGTHAFNRVAERYGLPTFPISLSMWVGDYTLVSDVKQALQIPSEFDFPDRDYIGPLLANLDIPLKPEVSAHLGRAGPKIYFSLGSSGERNLYREALAALSGTRYNVVAVYTTILSDDELPPVANNILLQKFVPAESVNRMVDLAVLHGGQGTFYTAAYAGRPVVGIPMQPEQQYNIDILVRNGSAIRLSKKHFRGQDLLAAIETILADYGRYRQRAEALATRLPVVDGAERGAKRIREIVTERIHMEEASLRLAADPLAGAVRGNSPD